MSAAITIRSSIPSDTTDVVRLAALDDRPVPRGDSLLAFVDGELAAARPLGRGTVVADPFRRTAHLLALLDLRAQQEAGGRAA